MKQKGYKPTRKCIKYIKKMISQEIWKVNEKIPTINTIANTLSISNPTVRNSLRYFERISIIENYGSLGFFLKQKLNQSKTKSSLLLTNLKLNIEATKMFRNGAIQLKQWVVQFTDDKVIALNLISGIKLQYLSEMINHVIKYPITLDYLLTIEDEKLFKQKLNSYKRQEKLLPLAKLISKYKKEVL